jgi:hypothetical protein
VKGKEQDKEASKVFDKDNAVRFKLDYFLSVIIPIQSLQSTAQSYEWLRNHRYAIRILTSNEKRDSTVKTRCQCIQEHPRSISIILRTRGPCVRRPSCSLLCDSFKLTGASGVSLLDPFSSFLPLDPYIREKDAAFVFDDPLDFDDPALGFEDAALDLDAVPFDDSPMVPDDDIALAFFRFPGRSQNSSSFGCSPLVITLTLGAASSIR